jgi:YidC/Oxa1 family membrane protein insertase
MSVQPVMVGPAPHPDMLASMDKLASMDAAVGASAVVANPPTAGGFIFSKPMAVIEALLTGVHETTGLPWWMTIALTTATVRLSLLPLQVYQSKAIARMAVIKPHLDQLSAQMKAGSAKGTDKGYEEAEKARLELQALFAHHNVKPWMSIVGALGQIPLWLSFFFTMRHMVRVDGGLGLDTGGALWFQDLTARDPYFVLPVMCGATFFGMVSLGDPGQAPGVALDARQEQMRTFMKGVALLMVPTTAWFESGVFVYWISTNMVSILQTVTLRQPFVRAAVGMPALPGSQAPRLPGYVPAAGLLGMSPEQAAAASPPPPMLEVVLAGSTIPQPRTKQKKSKRR